MRQYIRHPSEVPIDYQLGGRANTRHDRLTNFSVGGLCFACTQRIEPGLEIRFTIPVTPPAFHATGIVVWCRQEEDEFNVGIRFAEEKTAFAVRMVEQLCYIEHYRQSVLEDEGRQLTGEEAALEWIGKFADNFPH